MKTEDQINDYLASQPEPRRRDMQALHELMIQTRPGCKLWFRDGTDSNGKIVSNPNIGYGAYTIHYANGTTKEFFRIGLSANKSGISIYILGLEDKTHLKRSYGETIGKATVTGYCIKFKALNDINESVLQNAIRYGFDSVATLSDPN